MTTHGLTESKIYKTWSNMKARCLKGSNHRDAKYYRDKGISVCDEWMDFNVFLNDMGYPPNCDSSLDRIDPNKGYSKENCRWIPVQENRTLALRSRNPAVNNKFIGFRIPDDLHAKLMTLAKRDDSTVTRILIRLIRAAIKNARI